MATKDQGMGKEEVAWFRRQRFTARSRSVESRRSSVRNHHNRINIRELFSSSPFYFGRPLPVKERKKKKKSILLIDQTFYVVSNRFINSNERRIHAK